MGSIVSKHNQKSVMNCMQCIILSKDNVDDVCDDTGIFGVSLLINTLQFIIANIISTLE